MLQPGTRGCIVMLVVVLLTVQMAAAAQENPAPAREPTQASPDTAGLILVDAFVLRPLGLAATVLGTAAFVLTLPFSLPTRSAEKAAKALVVKPAEFTFGRPLGEVKP